MTTKILLAIAVLVLELGTTQAQVNSGSNGSDGAFNPATNIVINMADHPNGIYQYTSVTISNGVTVTFIPNANNTPVTWLVQGNCEIDGTVDVSGKDIVYEGSGSINTAGGPGGGSGGGGGSNPSSGQNSGGGSAGSLGGGGSFGSIGGGGGAYDAFPIGSAGQIYGNSFLIPLIGGSGGGGGNVLPPTGWPSSGGTGGGGAILIASSNIIVNGQIRSVGGNNNFVVTGGSGSGGAIRLVTVNLSGTGFINVNGGVSGTGYSTGGLGRVRIDVLQNNFNGQINGVFTQGYQPIIIPVAGQGVQLSIASVAGAAVSATPNGQLVTPDAIISGQQANPIPIVATCANLPLNTLITVTVKPASGASVSAVGYNTTGTLASSTATVSLNLPHGGGIIYATAATGN
jgi:hypothetical protein